MSETNLNFITTSNQTEMNNNTVDQHVDDTNPNKIQRSFPLSNIIDSLKNFTASLQDACQAAFNSPVISDRRPVLVYIHGGGDSHREELCEKALHSQTIIDYLNANYIVWTCNAKRDSNRFQLAKIWEEMFSTHIYEDFPDVQYPLLVGVMRLFEHNTYGIVTSDYQFQTLLEGDILMHTLLTIDCDHLLGELRNFKEKCHANERNPVFSFVEKTGLTWEIILEISKYLSLNDAINAFSFDILSLLDHPEAKFHLSNPSGLFMKKILPKIKHGKIVSLQFKCSSWSTDKLSFLPVQNELSSITFHDLEEMYRIKNSLIFYPNWTRLSLHYDCEINYKILENILYEFQDQLKRFELHCPGLYVDYSDYDEPKDLEKKMIMVEYFLLDLTVQSSKPMYVFHKSYARQQFSVEMKLMRTMSNIRYLHIIINNDDIERVCYRTMWRMIVHIFTKLTKIRIDVWRSGSENREPLMKWALELQTAIRGHRESFKFQIRLL